MSARAEFDYLIVGGGSAASVLAYRLSASGRSQVCVLEAGPDDRSNRYIRIPAGTIKNLFNDKVSFQIDCEPSWGTADRRIRLATGKVLGGSGAINGMVYFRGQASDYDGWAQMGATGWSFDEVLPYFRKSERRIGDGDPAYRGRDGFLPITDANWRAPICDAFSQAALDAGFALNPDYNGASQDGLFTYQAFIQRGRRVSATQAAMHPASRRANVDLRTDAYVTGLLFEGRRVVGAHYRTPDGATMEVRARRVILATGAIHTPKLLQLSGIGDPALLRDRGIAVRQALSGVGANLRDHYAARIVARARAGTDTINQRTRMPRLAFEIANWMLERRNIVGNPPILLGVQGRTNPSLLGPDYLVTFLPATFKAGKVGVELDNFPGVTSGGFQLKPRSTGYVRIKSSDPLALPEVQPNYLADRHDQHVIVTSIKMVRRLLFSEAMAPFIESETLPGNTVNSDAEWLDYARQYGVTGYHPVGTAKMGRADDPTTVVDPRLRVHGIDGLYVVDASVMPDMPASNTYAPTIMVAEKAADMIMQDAA